MNNLKECPYCGAEANIYSLGGSDLRKVECPMCGKFWYNTYPDKYNGMKNEVAAYLYYNKKKPTQMYYDQSAFFLGSEDIFKGKGIDENPYATFLSKESIMAFYPKNFSERVDMILLGIAEQSDYLGANIKITYDELCSAFFIKRFQKTGQQYDSSEITSQINAIIKYFKDNKLINIWSPEVIVTSDYYIELLPDGWNRVDKLQKQHDSNTVFIAMDFAEHNIAIGNAIKKAITQCGYVPRIMNEIEHTNQIVPEMLHEIRQAKFVIADLTDHNNGAYYEAGFALGNGKKVIQTCRKNQFNEDGHFDVKQINTILWESEDELIEKLVKRIKAVID